MVAHKHQFRVPDRAPLALEIDTQAHAVYARYSHAKVAQTVDIGRGDGIFNVDLDAKGGVVGVEIVHFGKLDITINLAQQMMRRHLGSDVNLQDTPIRTPELVSA